MTSATSSAPSSGESFVGRVIAVLKRARAVVIDTENIWSTIKAESADVRGLYTNFIMILVAIPPVCRFIGVGILGGGGVGALLGLGVVSYFLGLVMMYVTAIVLEKLAPLFGGAPARIDCLKLVAYSYSAAALASIFTILPSPILGIISFVLSLYSIYIFRSGIPTMIGIPKARRFGFYVVSLVAILVVSLILLMLASPLMLVFAPAAPM